MSTEIRYRSYGRGRNRCDRYGFKARCRYLRRKSDTSAFDEKKALEAKASEYDHFLTESPQMFTTEAIEEAMQKVMDNYAGGISTHYQFNASSLPWQRKR